MIGQSQSINKQFIDGVIGRNDICIRDYIFIRAKLVPGCFRLKIEYTFSHQTFCAGNVHTDTRQCIVLSRPAFQAITIFATIGL